VEKEWGSGLGFRLKGISARGCACFVTVALSAETSRPTRLMIFLMAGVSSLGNRYLVGQAQTILGEEQDMTTRGKKRRREQERR